MDPPDNRLPLTILHTNDFHNKLTPERSGSIARIFGEIQDPKLLLDAGDAAGSGNITFRPGGEPILDEMSNLGYSAMTIGNRDFHISRVGLRSKLYRARFPILCANIRPARSSANPDGAINRPLAGQHGADEPDVRSHVLLELPDWRVLVIGLTVPMVTERMWERSLSAYVFDPPVSCAARLVPELTHRYDPDLVILLTHIGIRLDRELANTVPGIDIVIGGHTHENLSSGEFVNSTLIAQAGSHGRYIGTITIDRPRNTGGRPTMSARTESL